MTTKGRAAMWVELRTCAAALVAFGLAVACGKTDTTLSGETHFVVCDTNRDCEGLSDVPTCSGGYCRDEQGNRLPDRTNGGGNDSDGSANNQGPLACASGCGTSKCATPGDCTLAAACDRIDCDTPFIDAEGCERPACTSDDDCPGDERCVSGFGSGIFSCKQSGNRCECQQGKGLYPLRVCSPITLAGARGNWTKLVVEEIVIGVPTVHTFLPDGSVAITRPDDQGGTTSETKQLSSEDLAALQQDIDGPLLRSELAKPHDCEVTKATDLTLTLELDTTTLAQGVAGCTIGSSPVPIFRAVYDLANRY